MHFMKCTDIIEMGTYADVSFWLQLFYSPGLLACRLGLAAAWSLFKFKHTSLIGISLRSYASYYPVQPPFRQGWGQVQKQQTPRRRRGQQPLPRLRPARQQLPQSLPPPPQRRPKALQRRLPPPAGRRLQLLHRPPALPERGLDGVARSLGPKADAN